MAQWPYGPTLLRLALALAIGLFIGIERERRRKEAGLRTFAFAALLGAVGALVDDRFALLALSLLGVLVILLNVETIHSGEGAEITTSAALLLTGFAGVLAGQGHTFTPTVIGVATAALLAWKEPLAGFSRALSEAEIRSAVLLAIVAFVVYPALPVGTVDPWHVVDPRAAWITVILIGALGFANYVLFKLYGARGIVLTGFLGGLVNSTVTIAELARTVRESNGAFSGVAFRAVMLATGAMLLRNGVIVVFLGGSAFLMALVPLGFMLAGISVAALLGGFAPRSTAATSSQDGPSLLLPALQSPFSTTAALKFGALFLALQVTGTIAERALGTVGFYTVAAIGGAVSSASAVASAASLAAAGAVSPHIASMGAALASATSALVDLPIVARVGRDRELTKRVALVLAVTIVLGAVGVMVTGRP